ncbi:MAG: RNB domain-containing ribonuclease [Treponema sp.]|jgi:exoribonuclease-2|nr:RNB domain-containing ribonuclease [Treponema sp.]
MMIAEKSLVVYKNRPALVKGKEGDRILISVLKAPEKGGKKEAPQEYKVRDKDIELIHPGPLADLSGIEEAAGGSGAAAREAWELLLENGPVSLKELAELALGGYSPASAWGAFCLLLDGLYFTGSAAALSPRGREEVEAEEKKREEKRRESGERESFLKRLSVRRPELPADSRFMQDVEALAYGKSSKSRTMRDLDLSETPEDAHALLMDAGFWSAAVNPHPARFGLSVVSSGAVPDPPPAEEGRRDLTGLPAFAVDSPWSGDPDDAVSVEEGAGRVLYVHVADPAASIAADSPPEREARDRGATLYLPEGPSRMLADEALSLFALGLAETSPALTFKITLGDTGEIAATEIFPSTVRVKRLTYEEADRLLDGAGDTGEAALRALSALAEANLRRRRAAAAVNIELPETHISLDNGRVSIEPIVPYRSADMVRECMLLAGEGAALWAGGMRRGEGAGGAARPIPFPYVAQETGDLPGEILSGMAGSYQLRRCMRPRTLSARPGRHWGLGLGAYAQVTSPLRRYTDLLAHIQIRALLRGAEPLSAEELAVRLAAAEAAAAAVMQAERASRAHWTMVYLSDKKDSVWDAVALEKKGNRWVLMIPALALETQVPLRSDPAPNDPVKLTLKSVHVPRGEAVFITT